MLIALNFLILSVIIFQPRLAFAVDLSVNLVVTNKVFPSTVTYIVGGCLYSTVPFAFRPDGSVGTGGISPSTPRCGSANIPEGAPAYIQLTGSPSIIQMNFYTAEARSIVRACFMSGLNSDGNPTYDCDSVPAATATTITSTATTSSTSTTTTATSSISTTTTINTTTTTTTTIPPTTTASSTTTTSTSASSTTSSAPNAISTCIVRTNIYGRKKGNGILKDCCKTSDDCYGSCKKGSCDSENNPKATTTLKITTTTTKITTTSKSSTATPTGPCVNKSNVTGQKKGNGISGDCCRNSNDCTGSCIKGKCDTVGNPSSGTKCTSSNYYGKKNGKGPAGVCCKTESDCKISCVNGKCIL